MKSWQYGLAVTLIATAMLTAGACTSGGNVDDGDGVVSDTSITESGGGALNDLMSDVESKLDMDTSHEDSSTISTVSQ